ANKFPPPASGARHMMRSQGETRRHADSATFGFKQGTSFFHELIPFHRFLFDSLHLLDEGVITDIIKGEKKSGKKYKIALSVGAADAKNPWYI
ncbi:hypothetical protein PMAYCL1PPCAC_24593, partial [Pristionchus mayeri]